MANFLGQLFGTKADRDMKELRPILQNVIHAYEPIKELTNDELRHKTIEFKEIISENIKEEEARIAEIQAYIDANYDMDVQEKQAFYKEILDKKLLDRALPEETTPGYHLVDVNSIEFENVREIGSEWMCLQALRQLNMEQCLGECGFEKDEIP